MEECGREAEAKAPTAGDPGSRPGPDTEMEEIGIPQLDVKKAMQAKNIFPLFIKLFGLWVNKFIKRVNIF